MFIVAAVNTGCAEQFVLAIATAITTGNSGIHSSVWFHNRETGEATYSSSVWRRSGCGGMESRNTSSLFFSKSLLTTSLQSPVPASLPWLGSSTPAANYLASAAVSLSWVASTRYSMEETRCAANPIVSLPQSCIFPILSFYSSSSLWSKLYLCVLRAKLKSVIKSKLIWSTTTYRPHIWLYRPHTDHAGTSENFLCHQSFPLPPPRCNVTFLWAWWFHVPVDKKPWLEGAGWRGGI